MPPKKNALQVKAPELPSVLIKTTDDYRKVVKVAKLAKALLAELAKKHVEHIEPKRKELDALYADHRASKRALEGAVNRARDALDAYAAKQTTKAVKAAERKAKKADNEEIGRELVQTAAEKTHVPKVEGVTYRTVYEFTVTDASKVPIEFQGAMLRPVDESAVGRMVRASKGQIKIPGVEARVVKKSSVKS